MRRHDVRRRARGWARRSEPRPRSAIGSSSSTGPVGNAAAPGRANTSRNRRRASARRPHAPGASASIRRPASSPSMGTTCFAIRSGPGECCIQRRTLESLHDVVDLDLVALSQGRDPGLDPISEPSVCTHGRRDPYCAERGGPLARAPSPRPIRMRHGRARTWVATASRQCGGVPPRPVLRTRRTHRRTGCRWFLSSQPDRSFALPRALVRPDGCASRRTRPADSCAVRRRASRRA